MEKQVFVPVRGLLSSRRRSSTWNHSNRGKNNNNNNKATNTRSICHSFLRSSPGSILGISYSSLQFLLLQYCAHEI